MKKILKICSAETVKNIYLTVEYSALWYFVSVHGKMILNIYITVAVQNKTSDYID